MLIKQSSRRRAGVRTWAFSLPGGVFLAASGVLLGVTMLVGIILGQRFEAKGQGSRISFLTRSAFALNVVDPTLIALKAFASGEENVPLNFAKGLASGVKVDHLVIDMKQKEFEKLSAKREEALKVGILFTAPDSWVRAKVTLNGVAARAKVRLKGDWPDHYETDKWSLRIRLRGDAKLAGMRTFSIQQPGTRNFIYEWVMSQALRREGILAPEYRFIDVTLNGTHKGIYALEEFFEKELIERASMQEGPILKFDEGLLWREYENLGTWLNEYGSFESSPVDGWGAPDQSHGSQFERAVGMLEGFRRGRFRTSEVFDADKLAAFIALRDLSGAKDFSWQNMRFYYNPVTSKLEPIAYDSAADPSEPIHQLFGFSGGLGVKGAMGRPDRFAAQVFADNDFFARYVRALERMSNPVYVDDLVAAIGPDLNRQLRILYQDYPYEGWSPGFLRRNQAFIRAALAPTSAVNAHDARTAAGEVVVDVANIQSLPVEVLGVSGGNSAPLPPGERVVLPPRHQGELVQYLPVHFPMGSAPTQSTPKGLHISYRVLGTETSRTAPVHEWSYLAPALLEQDWRLKPPPLKRPFVTLDKANKTLVFRPGAWQVKDTLVLPAGYRVLAGPGLRLDLRNGAKIISLSPLEFLGDQDRPIVIESSDGQGQGLIVLQAGERSTLRHVVFDNLAPPAENGWAVTGAVTFYESPVDLDQVVFRRSRSEDALNIKRSHFSMVHTAFVDGNSDCFDGDFVQGRVEDSSFLRCGNDAVDVSGSVLDMERVQLVDIGDKGVSAGENSQIVAHDLKITRAQIGIASKDLSTVEASSVQIADGGVGLTAFRKKPEFGEASISVKGLDVQNTVEKQLVERGSRLTIDGEEQPAALEKVESLFYGARFGKASHPPRKAALSEMP